MYIYIIDIHIIYIYHPRVSSLAHAPPLAALVRGTSPAAPRAILPHSFFFKKNKHIYTYYI